MLFCRNFGMFRNPSLRYRTDAMLSPGSIVLAVLLWAGAACAQVGSPADIVGKPQPAPPPGATVPPPAPSYVPPSPSVPEAVSTVFDEVLRLSVDPIVPEELAARTLDGFKTIDPGFALRRADKAIDVLYLGRVVAQVASAHVPGWSPALHVGIEKAVEASPAAKAAAPTDLAAALVNAMVGPFGPRARYLSPSDLRPPPPLKPGTIFGATWERQPDRLVIRSVDPEGSAARVKLEPGDAILEIDDLPVGMMPASRIDDLLTKPIGRRTTMQVARVNPKLGTRLVLYGGVQRFEVSTSDGVVVIRYQDFSGDIGRLMSAYREAVQALSSEPVGIVLDLRGNLGGTLDAAVDLASLFLMPGPVVTVVGSEASSAQRFAVKDRAGTAIGQLKTLPLVVVVNGETASGAEIVAGALQLRQRAVVVGTATHGMGEIDSLVPVRRLGAVRFTTGRIILPGLYALHGVGLAPTVCLAGISGGDAAQAVAAGVRTMTPYSGRSRAQLSPDERAAVARACLKSPREPAFDLAVAEYLARDAEAYRRALEALPANPTALGE